MKSKIMTITALLAVMVVMTGIVAATTTATLTVTNDPVVLNKGETKTQTVTLTLAPVVTDAIKKIEIKNLPAGITSSIDGTPGVVLSGLWTSPKTWNVDLTNVAAANGEYTITYEVTYDNDAKVSRLATIQAGVTAIPEFPTIALPIGAAIGLVFFFQHKKRKEE